MSRNRITYSDLLGDPFDPPPSEAKFEEYTGKNIDVLCNRLNNAIGELHGFCIAIYSPSAENRAPHDIVEDGSRRLGVIINGRGIFIDISESETISYHQETFRLQVHCAGGIYFWISLQRDFDQIDLFHALKAIATNEAFQKDCKYIKDQACLPLYSTFVRTGEEAGSKQ